MRAHSSLRYILAACALAAAAAQPGFAKPVAHVATEIVARDRTSITADPTRIEALLGEAQFDAAPNPLPLNLPSVGFEATATSELGDLIRLAGTEHFVESVALTMSSHAIRSDFPGASPFGFSHPITLKIYSVDRRSGTPIPGAVLASVTQTFLIPWRPEPEANATLPARPWRGTDGILYSGLAFTLTIDLASLALSLPHEIIAAVSFNTEHFGPAPIGAPGPYNYLHMGVTNALPAAGTNVEPDALFWKTAVASNYSDDGASGVNLLRRDPEWLGFQPAIRINDSPYGMLAAVAAALRSLPSEDERTVLAIVEASDLTTSALDRTLWDGNNRLRPLWGRLVFDLLAEAADQLTPFANSENPITPRARAALDTLLVAMQSLVETAVGDAVIGGGDAHRIARAQDAFDRASLHERGEHFDRAFDQLANAWREANLSLR
jgi:hypothetical protein